nr:3-oxoacyl-[acyl-carrier-protein] synthase 2-like [Nerophis lumbriciformis]
MATIITDYDCVNAAGTGIASIRQAITDGASGLRRNNFPGSNLDTWIGRVAEVDHQQLGVWQSRNNALANIGLNLGTIQESIDAIKRKYSSERVGIVMGSSTSSIDRTETAYADLGTDGEMRAEFRQPHVHNPHAPSLFVAERTGITGPAITINTACSSSAKVFATAARWIDLGLIDAAVVGGVDTLCLSVLHGFHSLQLVSAQPCRPFDADRDGINLGEAAGFAVLVRADSNNVDDISYPRLTGYGESSDAHHMSAPHPQGLGAKAAIEQALGLAGLAPRDIDYINLHGTASQANDTVEGALIGSMFPDTTLCSSTKGWTGHTLGAAGITEALIALDTFKTEVIPGNLNLLKLQQGLDLSITGDNRQKTVSHVMSNSFGFGGNNCCLVFSRSE